MIIKYWHANFNFSFPHDLLGEKRELLLHLDTSAGYFDSPFSTRDAEMGVMKGISPEQTSGAFLVFPGSLLRLRIKGGGIGVLEVKAHALRLQ